jgi:glycine cleavage system aminomethyltransferase T
VENKAQCPGRYRANPPDPRATRPPQPAYIPRLNTEHFYLTSAASAERQDEELLRNRSGGFKKLKISNTTSRIGVLGVMGPESRALLSGLTDAQLESERFLWLPAREIEVAGIAVTALRGSPPGYSKRTRMILTTPD